MFCRSQCLCELGELKVVILVVYVGDIVVIGNDVDETSRLKYFLSMEFERSRT